MGMVAIRCSKCGKMKFYNNQSNFMKDFDLVKNRPVCKDCKKESK